MDGTVVVADCDLICGNARNGAVAFGKNADAGVAGCFIFDTRANVGLLGNEKRNCLTLHVGAHEGSVSVVVFKEGDEAGCNGNHLSGRNVHKRNSVALDGDNVFLEAAGNVLVCKSAVFVKGLVLLSDNVSVFFVCRKIDDLVGNAVCNGVNNLVGSFNKAVVVDSCVACKIRDKTDVGAFRSLDRTHTSVVAVVNVSDFEVGSVSGKTAGAESRDTALMRELRKGVDLVHEL